MNKIVTTEYAHKAQTILWENLMVSAPVVGYGEAPIVPWEDDHWTLERISRSELESTTPREVTKRLKALEEKGIEYDCILIAHEKKRLLPFLVGEGVVKVTKEVFVPLALATAALAAILAVVLVGGLVLLFAAGVAIAMSALTMVDPIVILVLKDGTWIQIASWDE